MVLHVQVSSAMSALQGTVMPCNVGGHVMDKHKGRCVWILPTFVLHADDLLLLHCMAGQELTMHPAAPLKCKEILSLISVTP